MIKHYIFKQVNEKGEEVWCAKAVMRNCKNDAKVLIRSICQGTACEEFLKDLEMPCKFERTVVCDPRDKFDAALGLRKADERVLAAYNESRRKAVNRYIEKCLAAVNPLTYAEIPAAKIRDEKMNGDWYERLAAQLTAE